MTPCWYPCTRLWRRRRNVPNTDIHEGIGLDVREFAKFAKGLRKVAPEISKHLQLQLRVIGQSVADEYRSNIEAYSTTVPDSIKVRVSGATVSVLAGGPGVPMAGLLELGNAKARTTTAFNHPVFGSAASWVTQPMHPALGPAVESKFGAVERAAATAIETAFAELVSDG
jgi:hypothetical protein